jgi:hypothetical protein
MAVEKTASPLTLRFAPNEIPWNTGPSYHKPKYTQETITLIVKVARSHPLTLGFFALGASGLRSRGSIIVAMLRVIAGATTRAKRGLSNLSVFPIVLVNMVVSCHFLICLGGFPNCMCYQRSQGKDTVIRKIVVRSSQGVQTHPMF